MTVRFVIMTPHSHIRNGRYQEDLRCVQASPHVKSRNMCNNSQITVVFREIGRSTVNCRSGLCNRKVKPSVSVRDTQALSKTLTAFRTEARAGTDAGTGGGFESMEFSFDHEKLEVHRIAIQFVAWSEILLEDCKGKAASAKRHLDEASSSISNNIAEGNGKSPKRRQGSFSTRR